MQLMINLDLVGIMLLLGVLLRAKISIFQKMMLPASVLAGIIGMILMNLNFNIGVSSNLYTDIVNELFTVSFISIGLTDVEKGVAERKKAKTIFRGCCGMGLVWCILYAFTPILGEVIIGMIGETCNMDAIYGTLIPFAFTQGPGQAAAFGALYEEYGWENASMVGVTFASVGFLASFLFGVPMAKIGIMKNIAKNVGSVERAIAVGYYNKKEQSEYIGMETMYSGNIETLTFHFGLVSLCYILAVVVSKLFALMPGFFGTTLSGMLFMNGMLVANVVKWLMNRLGLGFLKDNVLQRKITGWTSDLLVVSSFMAVRFETLENWMVPILVESVVIALVTLIICIYFGQRFGDDNDFERTLGLYGTSTGTVPSGIALVRIVDPDFQTTTAAELGMMNYVMLCCTPVSMVLLGRASGNLSMKIMSLVLMFLIGIYIIMLKIVKAWGKSTYFFKNANK